MAPTNLNSLLTNSRSTSIIPLHPLTEKKPLVPDQLWKSIKNWKSELSYWDQEGECIRKMVIWKKANTLSSDFQTVYHQFENMIIKVLPALVTSLDGIEKEVTGSF